jgi:hypothetical protein
MLLYYDGVEGVCMAFGVLGVIAANPEGVMPPPIGVLSPHNREGVGVSPYRSGVSPAY